MRIGGNLIYIISDFIPKVIFIFLPIYFSTIATKQNAIELDNLLFYMPILAGITGIQLESALTRFFFEIQESDRPAVLLAYVHKIIQVYFFGSLLLCIAYLCLSLCSGRHEKEGKKETEHTVILKSPTVDEDTRCDTKTHKVRQAVELNSKIALGLRQASHSTIHGIKDGCKHDGETGGKKVPWRGVRRTGFQDRKESTRNRTHRKQVRKDKECLRQVHISQSSHDQQPSPSQGDSANPQAAQSPRAKASQSQVSRRSTQTL